MNEKSRNPLEKRSSSTRAKKVDYAALQEIKIEEVDCDDDFDDTGIVFQDKAEKWKKKSFTKVRDNLYYLQMKLCMIDNSIVILFIYLCIILYGT